MNDRASRTAEPTIPTGAIVAFGIALLGLALSLVAALGVLQSQRTRTVELQRRVVTLERQLDSVRTHATRDTSGFVTRP
ncbi:MAG: hypothetical protein HOP12_08400 [Candidatus Eisenbacteria bacterium]|uniref:Uncharacterized protein n=1 Tax=Eiseniibacteriota bacterium TaxID=2212470 RepID=A0A849SKG0_UNCEI|nr:hypothetical protein [Candidatus Eisenbacteria bacterium]